MAASVFKSSAQVCNAISASGTSGGAGMAAATPAHRRLCKSALAASAASAMSAGPILPVTTAAGYGAEVRRGEWGRQAAKRLLLQPTTRR
jgi:hypothetical protein